MLRTIVDRIAGSYRAVVMDTEAGLEHLSRRTTRDVDVLLVVTDPTLRGVAAARRVVTLVQELGTRFGAVHVLANRVDGDLPAAVQEAIAAAGLELVATLKCDPLVGSFDAIGRPLVELPDDDVTLGAVRALVDRLVLGEAALRPAAQGAAAQEAAALEAATLGAAAKGEVAC
jgi:CO dehydrogenase maturation factor